jgi:hypothetical protein
VTTSTDGAAGAPVRCSSWARSESLDPIGTVGSYAGYLLVEAPLPWPRDVAEIPELASLAGPLSGTRVRLQALVPSALHAPPEERRVILHSRSADGSAPGYGRRETTRGRSLPEAVDRLTGGDSPPVDGVDVLVCTHGRRDACCGSLGTDLALRLAAQGDAGVNYWRTSHTGGHRFAATFLVLPQGTAWAFADVDLVARVLHRSVPFASVADRYRGCAGLDGPQVQAVERAVLCEVGWDLLDRPRRGYLTGEATTGGPVVRLEADDGRGGTDSWEAVVSPGRTLSVPDCMKPLAGAYKTETEQSVSDLRPL